MGGQISSDSTKCHSSTRTQDRPWCHCSNRTLQRKQRHLSWTNRCRSSEIRRRHWRNNNCWHLQHTSTLLFMSSASWHLDGPCPHPLWGSTNTRETLTIAGWHVQLFQSLRICSQETSTTRAQVRVLRCVSSKLQHSLLQTRHLEGKYFQVLHPQRV